jgi:type I restriction enzyme S subunit
MLSLEPVFAAFEAEGTVFGSISKKDFHNLACVTPPELIVGAFDQLCEPLDHAIERNELESHTLATLRDTLLPKLISGELRVGAAERVVAGVV